MPRYRQNPETGFYEKEPDEDTTMQLYKEQEREVKSHLEPTMSYAMIPHPTVGVMPPEYTKATKRPTSWFGKIKDMFHSASRYITPELVLGIANAAHKTGHLKGNLAKDALGVANFLKGVQNPDAQKLAGVVGAIPAVAGVVSRSSEIAGQVPGAVKQAKERYFGAGGKGRPPVRVPGTSTAIVPHNPMANVRSSLNRVRR